jgi:hypothetical protein
VSFNEENYKAFIQNIEQLLDPVRPTQSVENIEIIGYGEISTVFGVSFDDGSSWACKRLPIFSSAEESRNYIQLYKKYNQLLQSIDLSLPLFEGIDVVGHDGHFVNYLFQQRLDASSICNKVLFKIPQQTQILLMELVVKEMAKVWFFNQSDSGIEIGLDAQLSNWAIKNYDAANPKITPDTELLFIDTSTPFIRENGEEQINGRLLLKSAPGILQPLLAKLFLGDVIGRYYSFRDVIIDLLANLYKEGSVKITGSLFKTSKGI